MKINISEEKGLNIIREKTKTFCTKGLPGKNPQMKLVILDEADSMNETSQGALCRMMEKFSKNVRFALICNFPSKIIEPIQSRCALLRFKKLRENLCLNFLVYIFKEENVSFDLPTLEALIFLADGDLRKILNQVETIIGGSDILKIGGLKKILPKLKASEILDFIFSIFRNEKKVAEENLSDFVNRGFSKLDFLAEIFDILKKTRLENHKKLKMLSFFSKIRLCLYSSFSFSILIAELRKMGKN